MRSVLCLFALFCGSCLSAAGYEPAPVPAMVSLRSAAAAAAPADIPVPSPAAAAAVPDLYGKALFMALHAAVPRRAMSYGEAKAYMYSKADNVGCNGTAGILTFYSRICVTGSSADGGDYPERSDLNGDGVVDSIINAEHIWPQSYFNRALPMVSDLFILRPTFATPNSRRGNLRFARVSKADYSTSCGSRRGKEGFEPCDPVKGDVARSVLYFVLTYHDRNIRQGMDYNEFWVKQAPLFLEWNRLDPPDDDERRRNDLVERFQGNRNPFIDDPALADRIGAAAFAAY